MKHCKPLCFLMILFMAFALIRVPTHAAIVSSLSVKKGQVTSMDYNFVDKGTKIKIKNVYGGNKIIAKGHVIKKKGFKNAYKAIITVTGLRKGKAKIKITIGKMVKNTNCTITVK